MTDRPIVVITDVDDEHIRLVQPHLNESLMVIAPLQLANGTGLDFHFNKDGLFTTYDGKSLGDAQSVWYRKPSPYDAKSITTVPHRYLDYSLDSLTRHLSLLRTALPNSLWVSDYYAIVRAENKTLQYQVAASEGLRIPDTLATNDPKSAAQFINEHTNTVVKRFGTTTPEATSFPTTLVTDDLDLTGLALAPAVFQEALIPKVELRVTVVGSDVFVAGIKDNGIYNRPDVRDWRMSQFMNDTVFTMYDDLSKKIQNACVNLVRRLGLQYGAIDLIIDRKNIVWFLEINPNGQWGFIEYDTGLPIGKSLAGLLAGVSKPL